MLRIVSGMVPVEDPSLIRPPGDAASADNARAVISRHPGCLPQKRLSRASLRAFIPTSTGCFTGRSRFFPRSAIAAARPRCFKAFADLNARYRFDRHVSDHLIAEGDWGAGVAEVALVQRDSGRTIRVRIASFFRIENGLVTEYRGFTDSFDAVEQVLGKIIQFDGPNSPQSRHP